jgi:hypothetical protein
MENRGPEHAADDAREVEITPSGTIREVSAPEATQANAEPVKATKLSPHTFGWS